MTASELPRSMLSPRDLARALGVSESSVKRWVDDGALAATRTNGGHRRIPVAEAIRFVRETGAPLVAPEALTAAALPIPPGPVAANDESVVEALWEALVGDEQARGRGLIMSLYLGGWSIAAICDGPLRAVLTRVGELWRHDAAGILIEHRATDTCMRALTELRMLLPPPPSDRVLPQALGGALTGDPYILPSMMAALTLSDLGFESRNLGPDTPVDVMVQAAVRHRPPIVWISVSVDRHGPALMRDLELLARALGAWQGTVVVGGRSAPPIAGMGGVKRVPSMAALADLARRVGASSP